MSERSERSESPVLQSVLLGAQWPTVDPFLFCAHHDDNYPVARHDMSPDAPLVGRNIGSDFAGLDGWNMYHGSHIPGFPQHPHRGFETITFVRRGLIDHADSLGATARFGAGDVQWMTAGKGIVHAEMFPLVNTEGPNPLQMFQVWLNLPAEDKMVDPYFTMLWNEEIPSVVVADSNGGEATITTIVGTYGDLPPAPAPPPNSWASRHESDLAIWHLRIDAGASVELPPAASSETIRTLYLYEGSGLGIGTQSFGVDTGIVVDAESEIVLQAGSEPLELVMLQGRSIGEPVAQYGPFVMNTDDEIRQAFDDYRRTEFGGWPWPTDDPTHAADMGRFAIHADGTKEER